MNKLTKAGIFVNNKVSFLETISDLFYKGLEVSTPHGELRGATDAIKTLSPKIVDKILECIDERNLAFVGKKQ